MNNRPLENDFFTRSEKSQGNLKLVRDIGKNLKSQGNVRALENQWPNYSIGPDCAGHSQLQELFSSKPWFILKGKSLLLEGQNFPHELTSAEKGGKTDYGRLAFPMTVLMHFMRDHGMIGLRIQALRL